MTKKEGDLGKEIAELRAELREIKDMMSLLINMMMEMEPEMDEGPERAFKDDINSNYLMYN